MVEVHIELGDMELRDIPVEDTDDLDNDDLDNDEHFGSKLLLQILFRRIELGKRLPKQLVKLKICKELFQFYIFIPAIIFILNLMYFLYETRGAGSFI